MLSMIFFVPLDVDALVDSEELVLLLALPHPANIANTIDAVNTTAQKPFLFILFLLVSFCEFFTAVSSNQPRDLRRVVTRTERLRRLSDRGN